MPWLDSQLRILVGLDRQLLRHGQLGDHVGVPLIAFDSQVHVAVRAQVLDADHPARKRSALEALPFSGQVHVFGAEADKPAVARDQVHRRRADESGYESVRRPVIDLIRRSYLLQPAEVQDGDPVAEPHRLDLVVRDVDGRGGQALLELLELEARRGAELGVEVGERLVEQEDLRLADERAGERDSLTLAA